MNKYICFLLLISCLACNQTAETIDKAKELYAKRDSIDKMNSNTLVENGQNINKATVYTNDGHFELTADTQQDHRIIGYKKPDLKSTRLIIFSVFINDVENNPFNCPLGAYYDLTNTKGLKITYQGKKDDFIKTIVKDSLGNKTIVYFEQKDINFTEREKIIPGQLKELSHIEVIENFVYRLFYKATDAVEQKVKSELHIDPKVISKEVSTEIEKANKLIDKYKTIVNPDQAKNKLQELDYKGTSLLRKYTKEYDGELQKISGVLSILEQPKQENLPGKISIKTPDGKIVDFESTIDQKILKANGQKVTAFYSQLKANNTVEKDTTKTKKK